jgi:hypothetical protein
MISVQIQPERAMTLSNEDRALLSAGLRAAEADAGVRVATG